MNDRLNRICLKFLYSGVAVIFFLYVLNNFICPALNVDRVSTAVYWGSMILFYIFFFGMFAALILLLLNAIRKSVFPGYSE